MKTPEGSVENNDDKRVPEKLNLADALVNYNSKTGSDPFSIYSKGLAGVGVIKSSGHAGTVSIMNARFNEVSRGINGLEASNNEELVQIAADSINLQKEIFSGKDPSLIVIPDMYRSNPPEAKKLTPEQEGLLAKAKAALAKPGFDQDALDKNAIREARQKGLLTDEPNALPKVESNTLDFTSDDTKYEVIKTQSAAERNSQTSPQSTTPEEVSSSQGATPHVAPVAASPVETQPASFPKVEASAIENKAPTPEALEAARKLKELEKFKEIAAKYTEHDDILRPAEQIMESPGQRLEKAEKDALENMEKITSVLEARKEESKSRLEKWGIGIKKGLDYYRGMKPRNKLLLGVLFAGASVLSGGGVTGMAIAAVTKTLAAGSYGAGFYDKMLKAEQDKGNNPNKSFLAARSILYGTVFALGTSALFSELASHVHIDTDGLADAASERFSAMKEGLKTLFGISPDAVVPDASPLAGAPVSPEVIPYPDDPTIITDYSNTLATATPPSPLEGIQNSIPKAEAVPLGSVPSIDAQVSTVSPEQVVHVNTNEVTYETDEFGRVVRSSDGSLIGQKIKY